MKRVDYIGKLVWTGNGEEDALLGLLGADNEVRILAETIQQDKDEDGEFLSVSYYTSDLPVADPQAEFLKQLYATPSTDEVDYSMHYSDITGYLWTDEKLNVGGHDLIEELKSNVGRYLYMTIEFRRAGEIEVLKK